MSTKSKCEVCGTPIEYPCDVCDKHALSNEQLAEMARRMQKARNAYLKEIWT